MRLVIGRGNARKVHDLAPGSLVNSASQQERDIYLANVHGLVEDRIGQLVGPR